VEGVTMGDKENIIHYHGTVNFTFTCSNRVFKFKEDIMQ